MLVIGQTAFPCLLGRTGRTHMKREGDGATPIGLWQLQKVYYRADRLMRPRTALTLRASRPTDAWCEDPQDGRYNRLIAMPPGTGEETFWRGDSAYDFVIATDHNTRPRIRGRGSAIFFHLIRPGAAATAGCIAVSRDHMRKILLRCGRRTMLAIWPSAGLPAGACRKSPNRS
jgi:L,D-peptidoglycan transpeptidase YkuD (ErfK/YbiS/YcfS/YnhG family)